MASRGKTALVILASLVALVALFYAVEDWRGWHTWNQFKREWEAKGERFDRASVVPPAVPDDQNFALDPLVASTYASMLDKTGHEIRPRNTNVVNLLKFDLGNMDRRDNGIGHWAEGTLSNLKPWQDYYRNLAETTNLFAVSSQPQSPAADVLLALSKYDATIAELRKASKLPESRFPVEYDKECPAAILLPHLAALKNTTQMLQLRAIAELQNGDSQKALDDVRLLLRLADSVQTEPILISHLVRIAILQIALQPIYEGLAQHQWSDADLSALNDMLAREDFLADYRTAMRGEMVLLQIGDIQFLRRHPEEFSNLTGDEGGQPWTGQLLLRLIPSGWFYQNQYRCARMTEEYFLPAVDIKTRTVSPATLRKSDRLLAAETKRTTPYNVLEKMLLPALSNAAKKFAYAQSSADLARTAIALERYRLAHGKYPESLDAITPQFIAQVPHDVIGGGPLIYRRTSEGHFVLYSIGWNEKDDGGVPGYFERSKPPRVDISKGDWVWRYPAN